MFKHQGESRTAKHNLQIAIILSFVAGIVNVSGFLSIKELITHVTGHFAFFIYNLADLKFWKGTIYLLYILCFLFGSFTSSFLIEKFRATKKLNIFAIPIILESSILLFIAFFSNIEGALHAEIIACFLLFAMGLQNSYVTKISDTVVRTTHLTGLFTDLGIELSYLFFSKYYPIKTKIKSSIKLRMYIIFFFFFGVLVGGFLYAEMQWELNTLAAAAFILLISLFYDDLKYRLNRSRKIIADRFR